MTSKLDLAVLEVFKDSPRAEAYLLGFDEYAGKLFVPSEENLRRVQRKVKALRAKAKTDLQKKVLDSMEVRLGFDEPEPVLDEIIETIFAHLAKEGINEEHLVSLMSYSFDAIDAAEERFSKKSIPVAVKALCLYRLSGVIEIVDAVRKETASVKLKAECDRLKAKAKDFMKLFDLPGFGEGGFEQAEKVFKRYGFDLGRKKFYRYALEKGLDYSESPDELEARAIGWIEEELPKFKDVTKRLAKYYKCGPTVEKVSDAIDTRIRLKPSQLMKLTKSMREIVQRFVNEDVVRINPKYYTRVVETPRYLTGTFPTGGAQFFNTFTNKPFQVYFQTTDPRRDPDKSISALLDLLVHEEYGHCVHHSNSVVGFRGRINPLELIPTLLSGPITEGLSFNREIEFLEAVRALETKKGLTKAERDYVDFMEKYGGLKLVNLEVEFQVRRWRLLRFLRVIGDVRVNTGKQGLMEFTKWAHDYTGVSRANMYFQLFPAHEGIFPGYATAYAVVGQEIRNLEKKIKDDKQRVKFSTYLCSIGYPPRSDYRKMLAAYAKKLR